MNLKPQWDDEGRDWPNRKASRFIRASGLDWHVQLMGRGPVLLLIHGTGSATHSWRGLAPLLARRFSVMSFDLPGHGFTDLPRQGQLTLPQMASAIADLLASADVVPDFVAGHSAGAAIAVRMTLDGFIAPNTIFSINGALLPFKGIAAVAFPALAKLLFVNPFAPAFLARRASDNDAVARLIDGSGSRLDPRGIDLYARLFRTERHVAATVGMMANWDLFSLKRDLAELGLPLILIAADRDRAVAPHLSAEVKSIAPLAKVVRVRGCGHLAHEECPDVFARILHEGALAPC